MKVRLLLWALSSLLLCSQLLYSQQIPEKPNLSDAKGRQGEWVIYFDQDWEPTENIDSVAYYRLITYKDNVPTGRVYDHYSNGQVQMEAGMLENERLDGVVFYYTEDGSYDGFDIFRNQRSFEEYESLLQDHLDSEAAVYITKILSDLYFENKDQVKALKYGHDYVDLVLEAQGENSPWYSWACMSLSNLYYEYRMRDEALMYGMKHADIIQKLEGENSMAYAWALDHLAWIYTRNNDYIEAEPLFFRAKQIIDDHKEEDTWSRIRILNDIGDFYTFFGRTDDAIKYLSEADTEFEKFGPEDDYLGTVIKNNLAGALRQTGNYERSLELMRQCIPDVLQKFGRVHRETANMLANISSSFSGLNMMDSAMFYMRSSLSVYRQLYGEEHKEYLDRKYQYGILYVSVDSLDKALPILQEVYRSFEDKLGEVHENTIRALRSYGFVLYRKGEIANAIPVLREVSDRYQDYMHNYFDYLSEESRDVIYSQQTGFNDLLTALTIKHKDEYPELVTELLDRQLRNKAILISTTNTIKKRILESNDRKLIELYNQAQAIRQELGKYSGMSPDEAKSSYGVDTDSLKEIFEIKDRELNRLSTIYASSNQAPSWVDIRDKLEKGEALVEIQRYRVYDLEKWLWTDSIGYVALIVSSKTKDDPVMLNIAGGNFLEKSAINAYSNNIKYKQRDETSYSYFWKPLEKELRKIDKVYFSADGVYHKINLQTLIDPATGAYLMDEKNIQIITSGRDLLEISREPSPVKLGMLIGNPSFGTIPEGVSGTVRGIELLSGGSERAGIQALPGAEEEVKSISSLLEESGWRSITLINEEAEEHAVKDMLKPNILHIATHGFFEESTDSSDPLQHSGLLFTGAAQNLLNTANTDQSDEDGILTSFEALNLNIDNTNLVVLSACETGLGEIRNGEGIYGLQRAFKIAGARTIIMSLWKVDDSATRELMTLFYSNWLKFGLSKRDAFVKAQQKLREKYKEPYYWGAFVVLGE